MLYRSNSDGDIQRTLSEFGFRFPRTDLARTPEEAMTLASELSYPVALKVSSPRILHKTDVGGVALNIMSAEEVGKAFERIIKSVTAGVEDVEIEGVEVQEMVRDGTEIIIGILDDPQFGPVIMFGLGGIFTEILDDVSFRVLPIAPHDANTMICETSASRVIKGYRGRRPIDQDSLVGLLLNASDMGMALAGRYESIDLNPIVVWDDQHSVLDAKFIWRHTPRELPSEERPNTQYLELFFRAQSVALVGASSTPGKIGHAILDSLTNHEFKGFVFPVNPSHAEICGLKCYSSLRDVYSRVDLAVVTTDLKHVPELLEQCASIGTHNMVIVSGGGKELGGEKVELESRIRNASKLHNVRIIGPNCVGIMDGATRLDTFFQVHERMTRPNAGGLAMISQSGTVGVAFLEDVAELGVSKFVSYGNRTDVDEADLLAYLAQDPATRVIAMYVEGFEKGRKFLATAKEVSSQKPIVVLKGGKTERGSRASLSHTGFWGGSYRVVKGAFLQAGLIVADSYEEFLSICCALIKQPASSGARVGLISNGAGAMVQGIDLLDAAGLQLAELSQDSLTTLAHHYPSSYILRNPVDVTGSASSEDYRLGIEVMMADPDVDLIMPWFVFQDTPLEEDIVEKLAVLNAAKSKPIVAGALGGVFTRRMSHEIEKIGIPVFHSISDWVAAARGLHEAGKLRRH